MSKFQWRGLFIITFFALSICGCASSGITVRSYIQDHNRVDQEMTGNAGYLVGSPNTEELAPKKKKRKVFVVEFTKEADPQAVDYKVDKSESSSSPSQPNVQTTTREMKESFRPRIEIPPLDSITIEETKTPSLSPTKFVEYTIEKNDTLQKISKKFYGSFSKWQKIYETNKEMIKNPDRIQPGITIKIPME